jgi:glutaredoxin 3
MLELYGTRSCPYTAQLREDLEWRGRTFVEYDVERDAEALRRMLQLSNGDRTVPVLVEDERIVQTGFEGRGCYAGGA